MARREEPESVVVASDLCEDSLYWLIVEVDKTTNMVSKVGRTHDGRLCIFDGFDKAEEAAAKISPETIPLQMALHQIVAVFTNNELFRAAVLNYVHETGQNEGEISLWNQGIRLV